jgi:hypothetical protein
MSALAKILVPCLILGAILGCGRPQDEAAEGPTASQPAAQEPQLQLRQPVPAPPPFPTLLHVRFATSVGQIVDVPAAYSGANGFDMVWISTPATYSIEHPVLSGPPTNAAGPFVITAPIEVHYYADRKVWFAMMGTQAARMTSPWTQDTDPPTFNLTITAFPAVPNSSLYPHNSVKYFNFTITPN